MRHIMKREVNQKSVPWALVFTVSFIISVFVLSEFSLTVPIILLIITINPLLFGIYTFKLIQGISSMDEVQIRIQLEAVSIAFVLSLHLAMILGLLELIEKLKLESFSFLYIFPLFFLFYFIGLFISKQKYR